MKTIYILLTGQIKIPNLFDKIIEQYLNLLNTHNIKILLCTWSTELNKLKSSKYKNKIISKIYGPLKDNGDGNIIAQASLYRNGIKYIKEIEEDDFENVFILKSRPDVLIKKEFLKEIFNMDLKIKIKDPILKYKIWTGWAHATKPFYLEDAYFYSNYYTMSELQYFDEDIFKRKNIGQGISHIRRFIIPFLYEYPILIDYITNKNNLTENLHKSKIDLTDKYQFELFSTYYKILNEYFVIYLTDNTQLKFRLWNTKRLEINYNHSLSKISQTYFNTNLKLIHNNKLFDFNK